MKSASTVVVVEDQVAFTLVELSRVCRVEVRRLQTLVDAGVLEPAGQGPADWRFGGDALRRARAALRLARDFEMDDAATALVLDLLDEVARLRAEVRRLGG